MLRIVIWQSFWRMEKPVPFTLGELRDNTASVGFKNNYPGDLVHFFIGKMKFKHLFDLEFHETLQNFRSFRQNSEDILYG
jgi:hypothetical protein